jgi:hypothetical protein
MQTAVAHETANAAVAAEIVLMQSVTGDWCALVQHGAGLALTQFQPPSLLATAVGKASFTQTVVALALLTTCDSATPSCYWCTGVTGMLDSGSQARRAAAGGFQSTVGRQRDGARR